MKRFAASGSYLLVASEKAVHTSSDGGNTWTVTSPSPDGFTINCIAAVGGTCYLGTDRGLFLSLDNGATWQPSTLQSIIVRELASRRGSLYALCTDVSHSNSDDGEVRRSDDGGKTWVPDFPGLNHVRVTQMVETQGVLVAATFNKGVYRSFDAGSTWQRCTTGLDTSFGEYMGHLVVDGNRMLTAARSGPWGVLESTDIGLSWHVLALGDKAVNSIFQANTSLFAIRSDGLFRSSDHGATWQKTQADSALQLPNDMNDYGNQILSAVRDAVFRSADGGMTWDPSSTGIAESSVWDLLPWKDGMLAFVWDRGAQHSTDHGITWSRYYIPYLYGHLLFVYPGNQRNGLILALDNGVLIRTFDSTTWEEITPRVFGWVSGSTTGLVEHNDKLYFSCYKGIAVSSDHGATWKDITTTLAS
ncbi:MAG: hypothetical protein JSS75_09600 [Bacteroidetes bacterium]|nr:hypothetical protein [Bacteroidota bacterium]